MRLSQKSLEIACSILNYQNKRGMPPTVDEIRNFVGLRNRSTVYAHLKKLKEEGVVDWVSGESRTLNVLRSDFVVSEYARLLHEKRSDYIYK
ncbi:transcriptional regulator [Paenibacillus sacheonensis]|uniref:Transcriptional regulator n=1 Tax=Paenibacillus sacheonensis TaxID=742054 RepID=A0A7X4YUJ7_9BACL|nr:transcriptional regulator [Paenibacillus sacheonensis]MBM7567229.1 SOS-response transcriptional repressor LexA [Paenibacillus sacheonensis]NBC72875.1 transcriptional regulator [Paenibacillus sacheonensis]